MTSLLFSPPAALRRAGLLCALSLLLVACGPENDDWRAAQSADTSVAYAHFVAQYPSSSHAGEARQRGAARVEEEAWQQTVHEDTLQAYQQHLLRFPQGKWAQEARQRIDSFVTAGRTSPPVAAPVPVAAPAAAPVVAPAAAPVAAAVAVPAPVVPAVPAPAINRPVPAPAPAPVPVPLAKPAPVAVQAGYGAQLGAFSAADKGESAWQTIQARFPGELSPLAHQVVQGKAGSMTVYRLQVPQPTAKAARALCAQIAARGQACVVYHP